MKDDIEKILTESDTNEVLTDLAKEANEITEVLVIYTKGTQIYWQHNGVSMSRLFLLMESVKYMLFKELID